jgi:plastocyanin
MSRVALAITAVLGAAAIAPGTAPGLNTLAGRARLLSFPSRLGTSLPSKPPSQLTALPDTTLVLRAASSALEFQPPAISARQGTLVRLRFINAGTLPHNVVLVRDENDIDQLAIAAYQAAATGYVPVDLKAKLIAYSALASPGDTVEVSFTAPPPGVYRYVCLFPGHANSMWGTFRSLR